MNDNGALKQLKTDTDEIRERIPVALWDKVSEDLSRDQCYSYWQYCLECIQQMADAWEEVNGENLIWIPGHYEKKTESKSEDAPITKVVKKCECYHLRDDKTAECWGTKERGICSCSGDVKFCNFYHNRDKIGG